jgi:tetratricopeptide (TPR) repeat protein
MSERRPTDKKDPLGDRLLARLPLRHYSPPSGQGMTARQHFGITIGLTLTVGLVIVLFSINMDSPQHACEDEAADPLRRIDVCSTLLDGDTLGENERARAYAARGNVYFRQHKFEAAIADYGESIARDPDKPANWFNQGSAYFSAGRYKEAIRDFSEVIELNPDAGRAWLSRGYAQLYGGDPKQAIADLDQAIALNPRTASGWNGRGLAYLATGQYERAVTDFDEAIRLDPRLIEARISRATAFGHKGDRQRAIAEFDNIVGTAPDNPAAWSGRGDVYFLEGDYDRAIADYDTAIRLDRGRADLWKMRGDAYLKKGDYAQAVQQYDQALDIDRDNAPDLNALAWLQSTSPESSLRDGIKAVTLAERAVRLDAANANYRDTLAAAHAEAGHFIDAVREQERAVRMMEEAGTSDGLAEAKARLELYRENNPYRE